MPQLTLLETANKKSKPISQAITALKAQVDFYLSQIEGSVDDNAAYLRDILEDIESLLKEIK